MKDFFLSPAGMGYVVVALLVLGTILKTVLPKKVATIEKVEGLAFKIFNFVEKAIPDDVASDTKLGKALSKADLFAQKFVEEYGKKYGKAPGPAEMTAATDVVEKLVYNKNLKK